MLFSPNNKGVYFKKECWKVTECLQELSVSIYNGDLHLWAHSPEIAPKPSCSPIPLLAKPQPSPPHHPKHRSCFQGDFLASSFKVTSHQQWKTKSRVTHTHLGLQNGLRDSWEIVVTIFHSTWCHCAREAQIFTFDPALIRGIDSIPLIVKVEELWWCTESKRKGGPTVI